MQPRVLSGMRPTGAMHLGHYHGALKNWVRLQHDYDCFYFVADLHAITVDQDPAELHRRTRASFVQNGAPDGPAAALTRTYKHLT